jgi:hypothetical protein
VVGERDGVVVGVAVGVFVRVAVGVLVGVLVGVAVGVFVGVRVGVFVAGSRPFPVKATLCGLSRALSVMMLRLALRVPDAVGAKLALMVHVLFGAREAPPQVSDSLKSLGLVPVRATLLMVRVRDPVLLSVTVCVTLCVLTS